MEIIVSTEICKICKRVRGIKKEKSDLGKVEFVLLHTVKVEGRKILIYFWSMVKISINTIFLEKY